MQTIPQIRVASDLDAARIRQIAEDSYAMYSGRMDRRPTPLLADYENLIDRKRVFVIEAADQIAGYVVLLPGDDGSLLLDNIAVAPEAQKRGLGRMLVNFAENMARKANLAAISLYTNEVMTENIAWYASLGYSVMDRRVEEGYRRVYFKKML